MTFTQAAFDAGIKGSELLTLLCLHHYADENRQCHPGTRTIAKQIGLSKNTVKRHLNSLVEAGHVRRETRVRHNESQDSNLYTILLRYA